jgi:hypothetical protein
VEVLIMLALSPRVVDAAWAAVSALIRSPRPRDRSDHHRQARQMGQALATSMSALLARALS